MIIKLTTETDEIISVDTEHIFELEEIKKGKWKYTMEVDDNYTQTPEEKEYTKLILWDDKLYLYCYEKQDITIVSLNHGKEFKTIYVKESIKTIKKLMKNEIKK